MKKILTTRRLLPLAIAVASVMFAPAPGAKAGPGPAELKGYYKNIYSASGPAAGQGYYGDLNRLRLELDVTFTGALSAFVAYDNEIILGSVLDTAAFNAAKDARGDNLFDLTATTVDKGDFFWRQSIHRAYLRYSRGRVSVTAGRQRVPLGVGLIWNPSDLLDPADPLQIERDERPGTDAVTVDISTGALSAATFAVAPGNGSDSQSWFARHRINRRGFDISAMAGNFRGREVIGVDFSGYAGESGVRGEFTYTAPEEGDWFARALVGIDHTFPSTLYITVEYLYNGGNDPALSQSSGIAEASNEILTKNRNFLGLSAAYEITPLLWFESVAVFDMDGKTTALGPSLRYNIFEDLDLGAGVQVFTGRENGEYGTVPDLFYATAQFYF